MKDNIEENNHDVNENYPIDNNSDKDNESKRNTKRKEKIKKHVVVKQFSGAKVDNLKRYMKPTQEKSPPTQTIFHIGTNNLVTNKNSNKVPKKMCKLSNMPKLMKTR